MALADFDLLVWWQAERRSWKLEAAHECQRRWMRRCVIIFEGQPPLIFDDTCYAMQKTGFFHPQSSALLFKQLRRPRRGGRHPEGRPLARRATATATGSRREPRLGRSSRSFQCCCCGRLKKEGAVGTAGTTSGPRDGPCRRNSADRSNLAGVNSEPCWWCLLKTSGVVRDIFPQVNLV